MPPQGVATLCPQPFLPFSRDLDKLAATCRVKQNRKKKNSKRETPIAVEYPAAQEVEARRGLRWQLRGGVGHAGVVLDGSGHVYRCAPILGYMRGWSREPVLRYARIRRWTASILSKTRKCAKK